MDGAGEGAHDIADPKANEVTKFVSPLLATCVNSSHKVLQWNSLFVCASPPKLVHTCMPQEVENTKAIATSAEVDDVVVQVC